MDALWACRGGYSPSPDKGDAAGIVLRRPSGARCTDDPARLSARTPSIVVGSPAHRTPCGGRTSPRPRREAERRERHRRAGSGGWTAGCRTAGCRTARGSSGHRTGTRTGPARSRPGSAEPGRFDEFNRRRLDELAGLAGRTPPPACRRLDSNAQLSDVSRRHDDCARAIRLPIFPLFGQSRCATISAGVPFSATSVGPAGGSDPCSPTRHPCAAGRLAPLVTTVDRGSGLGAQVSLSDSYLNETCSLIR